MGCLFLCCGTGDGCATLLDSHLRRSHNPDLLHRISMLDPGIKSALQRTHTRDAAFFQLQRHPGAGRFVGSSAVEDDVAVTRDLLVAYLQLLRRQA
jgi:hypothetical protein